MIFVTVGTHEQPFDRLIRAIDQLKKEGKITEEVIMQIGYSQYEPVCCTWQRLYPYQQMMEWVEKARIVITHGGPSSFIMPLQIGKIPIVVPRQKQYGEHVNDHQLAFARAVAQRQKNIVVVEDVEKLEDILSRYEEVVASMSGMSGSNNQAFNENLQHIVEQLFQTSQKRK
jgi:UDP-N-acetylglucosamine transferase subunit ALG13